MAQKLLILLGTTKGAFIVEADAAKRTGWELRGPFCNAININHVVGDPATGTIYAGGGNKWVGQDIWKSADLGATWTKSHEGLAYGEGDDALESVWSLAPRNGYLYAGVKPAGLFRSDDGGKSWKHLPGLRNHPSREKWMPGGAGLVLHSLVPDPNDEGRLWVGISAAGVFQTDDGGASWEPRNRGTRADYMPEDQRYPEVGQCVHSVVKAAGHSERLYQQNHCGMYRSDNGGRQWESIEAGLPSSFGFAAAAHPRDPDTAYLLPLTGAEAGRYMPDAKAAVWRTRDGGKTWQDLRQGLPQSNAFFGVLRQAMATDRQDPAGIYFGSNTGLLYASTDEGENWSCIAQHLPTIFSVETLTVDA